MGGKRQQHARATRPSMASGPQGGRRTQVCSSRQGECGSGKSKLQVSALPEEHQSHRSRSYLGGFSSVWRFLVGTLIWFLRRGKEVLRGRPQPTSFEDASHAPQRSDSLASKGVGARSSQKDSLSTAQLLWRLLSPHITPNMQQDLWDYVSAAPPAATPLRMVILRGPPGLGKSTYAQRLLSEGQTLSNSSAHWVHTCSTDYFFSKIYEDGSEKYSFNKKLLGTNHSKNQERVQLSAKLRLTPLIIDNTCMTLKELAPYKKLAKEAGYGVQVVEPWEIEPKWEDMDFLVHRNSQRRSIGKDIDAATLRSMLSRFEPQGGKKPPTSSVKSRGGGAAPMEKIPRYVGVSMADCLPKSRLREVVWAELAKGLNSCVPAAALKLDHYAVPKPLHITTFFGDELRCGAVGTAALADAVANQGKSITVHCGAIAFIPSGLACLVVTRTEPALPAPQGKLLHITLAVRAPFRPVQSNDLLHGMSTKLRFVRHDDDGEAPSDASSASITSFSHLSLAALADSAFEELEVEMSGKLHTAYLVPLEPALVLQGTRAHFQA